MNEYSGTRVATTRVKFPYMTTAPLASGGYGLANPAPFILTNNGRGGSAPEKIQIHDIEIVDQSWGDSVAVGNIFMRRVLLNSEDSPGPNDALLIIANDSTDILPSGIKAYQGFFPYASSEDLGRIYSTSMQALTVGTSIQGNLGTIIRTGNDSQNLIIPDGYGFVIETSGYNNSTLDFSMIFTANDNRFFINSLSGTAGKVIALSNRSGASITIDYVNASDVFRSAYPTNNFNAIISSAMVRIDRDSNVIEFDSQYTQPDWVNVGRGFFVWSMENWIDYGETIASFIISKQVGNVGRVGAITKDFLHKHLTTRILLPGESLVVFVPSQQSYFGGEFEIKATYSTYSLETSAGGGGEYSYAY